MKLQYNGRQYHLNIPKSLVEAKNLEKGDQLKWEIDANGDLVIRGVETEKTRKVGGISDKEIKEKLVEIEGPSSDERDLVHQEIPVGYHGTATHEFYGLRGSPGKAYAIKRKDAVFFFEKGGQKKATWRVPGEISHDISETEEERET